MSMITLTFFGFVYIPFFVSMKPNYLAPLDYKGWLKAIGLSVHILGLAILQLWLLLPCLFHKLVDVSPTPE